jgi:hypothetical protein
MKKFALVFTGITFILTGMAFAGEKGTKLYIPLLAERSVVVKGKKTYVRESMTRYNARLKKAGFKEFPEYVEVSDSESAKQFDEWRDEGDKIEETLKLKLSLAFGNVPDEYQSNDHAYQVCYDGDGMKVANLVSSLADSVFSDQLNVYAWKYRSHEETSFSDDDTLENFKKDAPAIWKEWTGKTDAVLILTSYGDEGTDSEVNIISKCRFDKDGNVLKHKKTKTKRYH